jgi:hypothetical protein
MYWDVVSITLENYLILSVRFADGVTGKVRFLPSHLTGVFKPLAEPDFFAKVSVNDGVVTWPGEIDLAPDAMHAEIKQKGEWILK